jgi:enoyl-CoA hydratase
MSDDAPTFTYMQMESMNRPQRGGRSECCATARLDRRGRDMIEIQDFGRVRVLTLSSGTVHALDVDLLAELREAVHGADGGGLGALVLTGAGSVFCAGVDLGRVLDGGAAYTERLLPALSATFEALFDFPGPTVAAINGAAIAGGCVLACACDVRLIVPDAPIGASELRVGVPFPAAALEILRYACGDQAETVMLSGQLYQGADAVALGLAHDVVDDDLRSRAVGVATDLATIPADSYANTKGQLRAPIITRMRSAGAIDDDVRRIWGSPQTADAIRAHLERLRRRER